MNPDTLPRDVELRVLIDGNCTVVFAVFIGLTVRL